MKSAYRTKYGSFKVLSTREVEKPTPRTNQVLIKVYASTVNRTDCHVLTGLPLIMRLFTGMLAPRLHATGCDFAGIIEAKGSEVQNFEIGDKVMGFGGVAGCGSHTDYLVFRADRGIVRMPSNLDYEKSAACIEGGFYAISTIARLDLHTGQKALVYGASGAIGSATVQLLKARGLHVTAVCRQEHFDLMKNLGAEKFIDYTTHDFTRDEDKYNYLCDAVGKVPFVKCRGLLTNDGVYSSASGNIGNLFFAITGKFRNGPKVAFYPPDKISANLQKIVTLIEEGKFKPVIDRTYPLDEIGKAFEYVASGKKVGNVVVKMNL